MANKIALKTKLTAKKPKPKAPEASGKEQPKAQTQGQGIGLLQDTKTFPRSYRWREADLEMIERLRKVVNDNTPRKIDVTKILRGAMLLAEKAPIDRLLKAIAEAEANSLI